MTSIRDAELEPIWLSVGRTWSEVIGGLLASCEVIPTGIVDAVTVVLRRSSGKIAIETMPRTELERRLIGSFEGKEPRSRKSSFRRVRVTVDDRAPRLRTVALPERVVDGSPLVVVSLLAPDRHARRSPFIGIWAELSDPAVRVMSRLSDPREGLTAEVALAVNPDVLIGLATDRVTATMVGFATADQVAAELFGLLVTEFLSRSRSSDIGPWEDPLIQRSAELGVGIDQPAAMELCVLPSGIDASVDAVSARLAQLAARRLGIQVVLRQEARG